jgi:hypothetical protein
MNINVHHFFLIAFILLWIFVVYQYMYEINLKFINVQGKTLTYLLLACRAARVRRIPQFTPPKLVWGEEYHPPPDFLLRHSYSLFVYVQAALYICTAGYGAGLLIVIFFSLKN